MKLICKRCNDLWENHTCYWSPCVGCKDGHSSFWRTITNSKEWLAWEKENSKRMNAKPMGNCFDVDECREVGIMSKEHWAEFIKFVSKKTFVKYNGKIK